MLTSDSRAANGARRLTVEDVDPDLRGLARALPAAIFMKAPLRRSVNMAMGLIPRFGVQAGVRLRRVRSGDLRLRLYEPHGPRAAAALLWIHGGGLIANRPVLDDRLCSRIAGNLRLTVVSVDYRLAPEHPFPAGLDDCDAAWRWILRVAPALGIDPARIAIGGQSAGGGLAAALAQRLADGGGQQPEAQWLFSPMLDDRTAGRRDLDDVHHFIWTNELNHFGWRAYLGAEPGSAEVPPYAVPARCEDLRGFAPAWIGVGDIDLFHDEVVAYADRLRDAGVETTLDVVPGAPHGFEAIPGGAPVASRYNERADAWLADRLL